MRNEEEHRFAGKFQEQIADLRCRFAVEISRRFVGQKERRPINQGPGNRDSLPFAAGKFARSVVQAVGQADSFQEGDALIGLFGTDPSFGEKGYKDVFQCGTLGQKMMILKNETDFSPSKFG